MEPGFADAATTLAHFLRKLGVETDRSDVHHPAGVPEGSKLFKCSLPP